MQSRPHLGEMGVQAGPADNSRVGCGGQKVQASGCRCLCSGWDADAKLFRYIFLIKGKQVMWAQRAHEG